MQNFCKAIEAIKEGFTKDKKMQTISSCLIKFASFVYSTFSLKIMVIWLNVKADIHTFIVLKLFLMHSCAIIFYLPIYYLNHQQLYLQNRPPQNMFSTKNVL